MLKYLDGNDIAVTARMMRTIYKGAIIIVEGGSDSLVYSSFVDKSHVQFIVANGKKNAIDALAILEKDKFEGILAIVDSDFWNLEKTSIVSSNILITDTHDLETMILRSECFDRIEREFVDSTEARKLSKPIKNLLLENCLPIGYFRWINSPEKNDLHLNFSDLDFDNFIEIKNFTINVNKLIEEVMEKSNDYSLDKSYIKSSISNLEMNGHDPWQVCSGHDIIQLLSIGLNRSFGYKEATVTLGSLNKMIRLSYNYLDFNQTNLFKKMLKWEEVNDLKILLKLNLFV